MRGLVEAQKLHAEKVGNGVSREILAYDKNLMMVRMTFEQGAVGANHSHPHEQITYIISGEFEYTYGDEVLNMKPGDSVFVPSGLTHGIRCISAGMVLDAFTPCREDFLK